MEKLDTEKLRETLQIMKEFGAVFLKCDELIIEFPRFEGPQTTTDAIGFEAKGSTDGYIESKNNLLLKQLQDQANIIRPVGYSAIFGDRLPKFTRPITEGNRG